ncbi:MAG: hypothetical protein JXA25_15545 [Anaerolineales bacterium]|nr:hypothetical protein [Anaerolineales bacterium]
MGVLAAVWIARFSRRSRSLELVRLEAVKAWESLRSGVDLKQVIIKCYSQMSLVLKEDQGIE